MEAEANQFAAMVLMPSDDFREQTKSFMAPTLAQFEALKDRYEVSLTAVVLNWLKSTERRAMIVVSKDGFIDWSWGSERLFKSGVYFQAKKQTIAVPEKSLAALGSNCGLEELRHPVGVWNQRESVPESVVFADSHDMTISLLIYPKDGPAQWAEPEEQSELMDTYEAFNRGKRQSVPILTDRDRLVIFSSPQTDSVLYKKIESARRLASKLLKAYQSIRAPDCSITFDGRRLPLAKADRIGQRSDFARSSDAASGRCARGCRPFSRESAITGRRG
jgi:hypothetical protein